MVQLDTLKQQVIAGSKESVRTTKVVGSKEVLKGKVFHDAHRALAIHIQCMLW